MDHDPQVPPTAGPEDRPPPSLRSLAGLLQGVPGLVLITAGLAVGLAVVLATLVAIAAAFDASTGPAGAWFPLMLGLLGGQQPVLIGEVQLAGVSGSGRVGMQVVPFGLVTISALALTRIGFTRAWLPVPRGRWLPPLAGFVVAFVAAMLAALAALPARIDLGAVLAGLQVRPSLVGLAALGAGPWLLAMLAVRWTLVRNLLTGVVGLQVLLVVAVVVFIGLQGGVDLDLGAGELLGAVLVSSVMALAYGANLLVLVLWLPFLGAVGYGGTLGSLIAVTGETTQLGFAPLAEEVSPLLWLLPVLVVTGLAAAAWLQPPVRSREELFAQIRRAALGLTALFLPVLWFGRMSFAVSGEASRELGLLLDELGVGAAFAPSAAAIDVTFGAATMPVRFLPALLIWTVVVAVVLLLAAQASGADWASAANVGADVRTRSRSLTQRAREAAAAAKAAAEQHQHPPGVPPAGGAPAPPSVAGLQAPAPSEPPAPDLDALPPPVPPDAGAHAEIRSEPVMPDPSVPVGPAASADASPAPDPDVEPDLEADATWMQAPPPDPTQRRD